MTRSIYLISPKEDFPGYHSLEVFNSWRILNAVNFADLSITTFAALVPRDWHITICDERITRGRLRHRRRCGWDHRQDFATKSQ